MKLYFYYYSKDHSRYILVNYICPLTDVLNEIAPPACVVFFKISIKNNV